MAHKDGCQCSYCNYIKNEYKDLTVFKTGNKELPEDDFSPENTHVLVELFIRETELDKIRELARVQNKDKKDVILDLIKKALE